MPEVCDRRCLNVIFFRQSFSFSDVKYSLTGLFKSSMPESDSFMATAAVTVFVMEATRKRVSGDDSCAGVTEEVRIREF